MGKLEEYIKCLREGTVENHHFVDIFGELKAGIFNEDEKNILLQEIENYIKENEQKDTLTNKQQITLSHFMHRFGTEKQIRDFIVNEKWDKSTRMLLLARQNEEIIDDFLREGIYKYTAEYDAISNFSEERIIEIIKDPNVADEIKKEILKSNKSCLEKYKISISNIFDLSLNDLEEMPDICTITIENDSSQYKTYSRAEYIEMKKVFDKLVEGVQKPIKGDFDSEWNAFKEIYKRIAKHISYDYEAADCIIKREVDLPIVKDSQNLYGGLVNGTCVCGGYSNILKQALDYLGIDAKYIVGDSGKPNEPPHAWNQVKLGGNWFNVDVTWERDFIINHEDINVSILYSDYTFEDHDEYSKRGAECEKCVVSLDFAKKAAIDNEYGLDKDDRARFILGTENEEFIEQCLFDENLGLTVELLSLNKELVKSYIASSDLKMDILDRMTFLDDSDSIKKCLENPDLEFDFSDRVFLIGQTKDFEYIKMFIDEKIEDGSFVEMNDSQKKELIISTKNIGFIEECMQNGMLDFNGVSVDEFVEELTYDIEQKMDFDEDDSFLKQWYEQKEQIKQRVEEQQKAKQEERLIKEGKEVLSDIVEKGADSCKIIISEIADTHRKFSSSIQRSKNLEIQGSTDVEVHAGLMDRGDVDDRN